MTGASRIGAASRKDVEPRLIKIGMVEEVEKLSPQLHIDPLAGFEDLGNRGIDFVIPGPRQGVSSQVAIGSWRRPRKGTRIVPQGRSSQRCSLGYFPAPC